MSKATKIKIRFGENVKSNQKKRLDLEKMSKAIEIKIRFGKDVNKSRRCPGRAAPSELYCQGKGN